MGSVFFGTPCTFLSSLPFQCLSMSNPCVHLYILYSKLVLWCVYLYSKQGFFLHLYSKLALFTLLQQTDFVYSQFAQSVHTDFKKFANCLHIIISLSVSKSNLSWAAHKNLHSECLFLYSFLWRLPCITFSILFPELTINISGSIL